METTNTKVITITMTRYNDFFGRIIRLINGNGYTHAAISLDDNDFYSFNFKGFAIEHPKKRRRFRDKGVVGIKMQVTNEVYEKLKNKIETFLNNRHEYKYSRFGVVLCHLNIPHRFEKKYFCSQFVAEMLMLCQGIKLKKKSSCYTPQRLYKELINSKIPKQIVYSYI